ALDARHSYDTTRPPPTMIFRNNIVYNWKGVDFTVLKPEAGSWGSITITQNVFDEPAVGARMVYHYPPSVDRNHSVYSGNTYNYQVAPFAVGGYEYTLDRWKSASGEVDLSTTPVAFPSPRNSMAEYNASLGGTATFEAFMAECRKQSRRTWRDAYTAP